MRRDRMRTVVAIVVIAAMVLLAVGAVGASLLGGSPDQSASADNGAGVVGNHTPRPLGT